MPPPPPPQNSPIPSREASSDQQVNTVLGILGSLQPYLLLTGREIESGIPAELDGGVVSSASVTFMKACDRLDSILDDNTRWNLKDQDTLYSAMVRHYEGALELNKKQGSALDELNRPSHVFKPKLTTVNGEFIAMWGDAGLPGGLILGRGLTPNLAFEDFDRAFKKSVQEQLRFAPASEERLSEAAAQAALKKEFNVPSKKKKKF